MRNHTQPYPEAIIEDLRREIQWLQFRMDKVERRVKKSHHSVHSSLKMDLPIFEGRREPKEFIDWLQTVERILEYQRIPEDKQVKLVSSKLTGRASLWWEDLKRYRLKEGRSKIVTWIKMRRELQKKYLPSYYWQDMLFRHPQQQKKASPSVMTPTREFSKPPVPRLPIPSADFYANEATAVKEKEEQTLSEELIEEPLLHAIEEEPLVHQKEFETIMTPKFEENDAKAKPFEIEFDVIPSMVLPAEPHKELSLILTGIPVIMKMPLPPRENDRVVQIAPAGLKFRPIFGPDWEPIKAPPCEIMGPYLRPPPWPPPPTKRAPLGAEFGAIQGSNCGDPWDPQGWPLLGHLVS